MFCGRNLNNQINNLHERSLKIVYSDHESSFQELLKLDNSASIHHKNIRLLAIKLFKVKNVCQIKLFLNYLICKMYNTIFAHEQTFHLEQYIQLNYGLWSLRYLVPKI